MTTKTQQKPIPDTRYVKQGAPTGDFASGERTKPPVPEIDDFASGEHTLPASTATGDFASGEHTLPVPENPDLMDTLPPVPNDPDLVPVLPLIAIVPEIRA
jgi:hypothetical protein